MLNVDPMLKQGIDNVKCPLCNTVGANFLCNAEAYQVWRCPRCALDFVFPVPDESFLKSYYDRRAWFENGERGGYKDYDQQTQPVLSIFSELLAAYEVDGQGRYILDVGCGYATHLALAAERGWKAFGVEPSAHALRIARERHGNKIFLVDQIEALVPCEFNLILLFDVIEHTRDPYSLFFKLFSMGAIGSKTQIAITTPNARSSSAVSSPSSWTYRHPPSHLLFYSAEALRRLMSTLHFRTVELSGLHLNQSSQKATYPDEQFPVNDELQGSAGLLCRASGSDFKEFMHERFVPGTWSKIAEYEHLPRYVFAQNRAKGARVLDFGCGTGYGSALLAEVAGHVTGVDIDPVAIHWAEQFHHKLNLKFRVSTDFAAALPAESFDLITCFELIEHLREEDQRLFMENARRLLTPRGELIISTPNPLVTANYGDNPYHLREMNAEEFRSLLESHFRNVQVMEQWIRTSIVIAEHAGVAAAADFYEFKGNERISDTPSNFVAVCSQQELRQSLPLCYFDSSLDYVAVSVTQERRFHQSQFDSLRLQEITCNQEKTMASQHETIVGQHETIASQHETIVGQHETIASQHETIASQGESLQSRSVEALALRQAIQDRDEEIAAYKCTKMYRLRQTVRCDRLSLRKLAKIAYLLCGMIAPYRVRIKTRSAIAKVREMQRRRLEKKELEKEHAAVEIITVPRVQPTAASPIAHVSVVIPTKNAGPAFAEVLNRIQAQRSPYPIKVTIIDSGSSDGTVKLARKHGANVITIDPALFNHGDTRNQAIASSSGEVILLLTQDAIPGDEQLIENMTKAFDDPLVAGVYGRQVPRPDADVLTRRRLDNWLTGRTEPSVSFIPDAASYSHLMPYERYKLCNFDNVCSAIRRSVWKEIPFPANEFAEDVDWGKRILEAGWKIAYEPRAFVVHSHSRSISYEFKRTYLCHAKLYSLFQLRVIPTLTSAVVAVAQATIGDWGYVCENESALWRRISLLVRLPLLNAMSAYAQYRGARDQTLQRKKKIEGV